MALALYRRYRPKQFMDVIGQEDVARVLKNQVASGRVGHAYLFTGIRGTGKTTLAKVLAKAVNCPDQRDGEPCGVCGICAGIDDGSILDVTEIDAASNNGVDNIRELRDETAYTPAVTEKRVYIIDEVHMLSAGAFNALLKIMEEPPPHVLFILATTETHKIPATILSRCQRFDLKRISARDIAGQLLRVSAKEHIDLTAEAAGLIARLADGALRDALSILDTCASLGTAIDREVVRRLSGTFPRESLFLLSDLIASGDIGGALRLLGSLYSESVNPTGLCGELMAHFRNLLVVKVAGADILADYPAEDIPAFEQQSARFSERELIGCLNRLKELSALLPGAADQRLQIELSLVLLCGIKERDSMPQTRQRVRADMEPAGESPPAVPAGTPKEEDEKADPLPQMGLIQSRPEDAGEREFRQWPQVVEAMKTVNGLIYGFMQGSKAYLTPTHILIDCGESFKEQLREKREYTDILKEVIAAETGLRKPIGPYRPHADGTDDRDDSVERLIETAKRLNIPVEIHERG